MSRNLPLAALLALALARPAPAAAPPVPQPWQHSVERLIRQLGDPSFRAREEAERRLRADNIRIVPLLKKALGSPNAELRKRALRLIPVVEDATLFAPKRVTLKVTGKPLKTILGEITRQTGYQFYYWGGGGPADSYSCDFKDVPFWEAIDRLCRDAKLTVQPSYGDAQLRLQPGGYAPHAGQAGPFRFVANNFQMYRNLDFGLVGAGGTPPPARHETLTLTFTLYAEPKLPFLGMGEVRLESAYDSEGNSMLIPAPATGGPAEWEGRFSRRYYGGGSRQFTMSASVNLTRPSPKASTLKRLRGKVPVTVLVEQKPIVVTDKVLSAKGKKITVGKTSFHFEDVLKQANGQYQLKLSIHHDDKDNPGDYAWANNLPQRIELQDDKGNKYQNWGYGISSGANHANVTLTYSAGRAKFGPPARFIYQSWITRQHELTFAFKDLPLP